MITTRNNPKSEAPILKYQLMAEGEQAPFIATVDCDVKIDGLVAEVKNTFTLFNPNPRDMEGELLIPLPDDSILCNYRLDIDGKMRKAVIVSKQQGRQIVETEIRKNVDPGLVEKVEGNIHRIRVYPLPALGWRTVSIMWLTELSFAESSSCFHLPMGYLQSVDESSLEIDCFSAKQCPDIVNNESIVSFVKNGHGWISKTTLKKEQHVDALIIKIPFLDVDSIAAFEEHRPGSRFFSLNCAIPDNFEKQLAWQPVRIALAWDASGSSEEKGKELALLGHLIRQWQNLIIDVIAFREAVEPADMRTFTIKNGREDELFLWLQELSCDGATNLSALHLHELLHHDVEACFLLSDGLSTLGDKQSFHSPVPLHTICCNKKNNAALLKYYARQNGGHFYNLLTQKIEDITKQIISNRPVVKVVDTTGCESVHFRERCGRISLVGTLSGEDCSIKLARGGESFSCSFATSNAQPGKNIAKIWAFQEAEKCLFIDKHSQKIMALAKEYGLVTSGTSLLVLENVEQYLEHDIEPPEEEKELLSQYRILHTQDMGQRKKTRSEHLDSLEEKWQELVAWWKKDFVKGQKSKDFLGGLEGDDVLCGEAIGSVGGLTVEGDCADRLESDFGISFCCSNDYGSAPSFSLSSDTGSAATEEPEMQVKNILLKEWAADALYLQQIADSPVEKRYQYYLEKRSEYALSPSFFLDCGDYFLKNGSRKTGVRILSNLLEISMGNTALMRSCAYRLQHAGELDMAIDIFLEVLSVRDDEPQSHRDLALVLGERWQRDKCEEDLFAAMLLLWTVVEQEWIRFPEIELIALQELNRLVWLANTNKVEIPDRIEQRFIQRLDLDLRLTLSWDADLTDVDLHVYEPDGSHTYYVNKYSSQGARVSRDVVDGYGPEEYILKEAEKGFYTIKAHYYASHQQAICGPCTVTATLYTDYARENEQKQTMVLRLEKSGEEFIVGEIEI